MNAPDACQLLGVFESNDSGDADLPSLTLHYIHALSNNSDLIVGEKLTGLDNAVAVVVEKPNTTTLGIVLLNQNTFNVGETIKLKNLVLLHYSLLPLGDRNITNQYLLDVNHKPTYYDYSFVERKKEFDSTNRLKIVFKNFCHF